MLRQRGWRLEDLQTCGTAVVGSLVGWRLQVGCERLGIGEALAVQASGRLDKKGA